jgi:hypothetical protein
MSVRKREEVQKMLRFVRRNSGAGLVLSSRLALVLLAVGSLSAAMLPDEFSGAQKAQAKAVQAPERELFEEYGFEEGEQAVYGPMTVTAWRFRDSTGALSAYQFARPADAKPLALKTDNLASQVSAGALIAHGNFVLQFAGKIPREEELAALYNHLPKLDSSAIPVISTYLPQDGLIANSERFILGPASLAKFMPGVPPSVAAFHLSAEAQYARYRVSGGETALAIFNYPTPAMAREQADAFRKLPGTLAKRTGPLVAVIPNVTDADAAERILAKVTYQSSLTINEKTPDQDLRGFARTVLDMIFFSGIIILMCILTGALFAAIRIMSRGGARAEGERLLTLRIDSK